MEGGAEAFSKETIVTDGNLETDFGERSATGNHQSIGGDNGLFQGRIAK